MRRILCKNCSYEWQVEPDDNLPVADMKCPNCDSMGTSKEVEEKTKTPTARVSTPFFLNEKGERE